jgi:cobalt-zinc-cadmium efflux system outer membrane protein
VVLEDGSSVLRPALLISVSLLLSGCLWPVRQVVDQRVCDLALEPFDAAPESATAGAQPASAPSGARGISPKSASDRGASVPDIPTDVQTTAWMDANGRAEEGIDSANWTADEPDKSAPQGRKLDLSIPPGLPGSEAPRVELPKDKADLQGEIDRIYPELPQLPVEPRAEPGPNGKAYTLSDLQSLAAANSPTLRQAVAGVEAARGNLVQAQTYPNPTAGYLFDPANNNSTANTQGLFIDQPIRTGGKQKLGAAAAQKDLENAELALKRARNDLSTAVRKAYFTLLVDKETLIVTRSLARFTDDIYRLQTGLLGGALAAPYEPASLRAQAFATRLAYKQAIASYIYDWKQLVATLGVHHLPLTEVAGQVDRLIPTYDYDDVLAYTLQNHTDILTARNAIEKARYNLKLAQVTPVPDIDVRASLERDKALFPFGTYHALQIGVPLPIWDQNKGNIIAAQAGLAQATEESHRVEVALTSSLAAAFANYQNNLFAMEYYRRHILPDLVRYYRGIYARRQIDPNSPFGDLVNAQQMLSSNVTSYLDVLQNIWMSAVGVADFLQTDDLFQLARPRTLPELPDLSQPPQWPCGHEALAGACGHRAGAGHPGATIPGRTPPAPQERGAPHPASPYLQPPAAKGLTDPLSAPVEPAQPGGQEQLNPEDKDVEGAGDRPPAPTSPEPVTDRRGRQRARVDRTSATD